MVSLAFDSGVDWLGGSSPLSSHGVSRVPFIMDEIDQVEDIVFSQPMSSAEQVADAVIEIAEGREIEISMPTFGGRMTMLSYLFPGLRRRLRPKLYEQGRKNKEKYRKNHAS